VKKSRENTRRRVEQAKGKVAVTKNGRATIGAGQLLLNKRTVRGKKRLRKKKKGVESGRGEEKGIDPAPVGKKRKQAGKVRDRSGSEVRHTRSSIKEKTSAASA